MSRKQLSEDALDYFRQQGAKGGKLGGAKSWTGLSKAERSARALKASRAAAIARTAKRKAALAAAVAQVTDLERKHAAVARTKKKPAK